MGGIHAGQIGAPSPSTPIQISQFKIEDFDLEDSDRDKFENLVDILFVVDTTGSMYSKISESIFTICKIVERFKKQEYDLKFQLCNYRDHPPEEDTYIMQFTDLCCVKNIIKKLNSLDANGGGDLSEAVMDGLREGIKKLLGGKLKKISLHKGFFFMSVMLLLMEKNMETPSINGYPCGTKKEDISELLENMEVKYFLLKPLLCQIIGKMENIFLESFGKQYGNTIHFDSRIQQQGEEVQQTSTPPMWQGVLDDINKNISSN